MAHRSTIRKVQREVTRVVPVYYRYINYTLYMDKIIIVHELATTYDYKTTDRIRLIQ